MLKLLNLKTISELNNVKFIHTSFVRCIDQAWRKDQRLPVNPNVDGPLTNLPDFTYMDGRPTPLGRRQMRRVMFQRELAQKIVTGTQEIDYAISRHKKLQEAKMNETQDILNSKLKPKGHLLLKKK